MLCEHLHNDLRTKKMHLSTCTQHLYTYQSEGFRANLGGSPSPTGPWTGPHLARLGLPPYSSHHDPHTRQRLKVHARPSGTYQASTGEVKSLKVRTPHEPEPIQPNLPMNLPARLERARRVPARRARPSSSGVARAVSENQNRATDALAQGCDSGVDLAVIFTYI